MAGKSLADKSPGVHPKMTSLLLEFLQSRVNSFVKWDLVRFFHDNPHTRDTVENLARYIGRDTQSIERELAGLVTVRVLMADVESGVTVYRLGDDAATLRLIGEFIEACHDREFRVEAIHHVIRQMQFSPRHDF